MCLLFLYKEPDDDKAGFYFSRVTNDCKGAKAQAVLMAQELGLGRMYSMAQLDRMSPEEKKMVRMKQRIWWGYLAISPTQVQRLHRELDLPYAI